MNMINVLQRLAELDATNPNVVYEGKVKDMTYDMETMSDEDFQKTYHMSKDNAKQQLTCDSDEEMPANESMGEQGDIGGAHGTETISPVHGGQEIKSPDEMSSDVGERKSDTLSHDLTQYQQAELAKMYREQLMNTSFSDKAKQNTIDSLYAGGVLDSKSMTAAKDYVESLADESMTTESLKLLAGIKSNITECGVSSVGATNVPSIPASISVTAASGLELSTMLKDLMTLAGTKSAAHQDIPVVSEPTPAVLSTERDSSDISMRKMMDTMNDTEESYDNSPDEQIAGLDAAIPAGDDMHKKKASFAKVAGGDNPMQKVANESVEPLDFAAQLFAEYQKFKNQ